MREAINKACCPSCGLPTTSKDEEITTEEQQLRIENASLRAEVCTISWVICNSQFLTEIEC
jgi:homeobox-leucine zipper protein